MRTLLLTLIAAGALIPEMNAQSASAYYAAYSSGGTSQTMEASLTMQDGNMGSCNHVFTDSLAISGPGGIEGSGNFSNNTYSSQTAFTKTWNDLLPVGADGPYPVTTSSSAYCDCIDEEFYNNGGEGETIYPVPVLQSLTTPNYAPFQPYVDTPQSANQAMVIWGLDLTAGGASNPPYISVNGVGSQGGAISVTGFHLYSGWYVGETDATGASQINIYYSVDATATPGSYTLTLTTAGGSSSISFSVGDASPKITGVVPSSFTVGVPASSVQINGQNLGTNCPTLTFPFALQSGYSFSSCTDTQVLVNFTPAAAGSGDITFSDAGFGGLGWDPAPGQQQTAQSSSVNASNFSLSVQESFVDVSTGDTSDTIGVSANPSTVSYSPRFNLVGTGNVNSTCTSSLSYPNPPNGNRHAVCSCYC